MCPPSINVQLRLWKINRKVEREASNMFQCGLSLFGVGGSVRW